MTIRVWAEFISPREIIDRSGVELFARHNAIPGIALRPGDLTEDLKELLSRCMDSGVETMLWPLLEDKDGYWPGEGNAEKFAETISDICEWIDRNNLRFDWLAVDLEPPIYQTDPLRKAGFPENIKLVREYYKANKNPDRFMRATEIYNELISEMRRRNIKTLAAAADVVIHDIRNGRTTIQDLLETPVSTVDFDVISFMIYTSMMTGYSKGIISRDAAARLLYLSLRDAEKFLGARAGVSIGVNHTGKLEDEPFYSQPEELAPGVAAAKAANASDISIFCLEGILKSPSPDKWFEIVANAKPARPQKSLITDTIHTTIGFLTSKLPLS